MIRIDTDEDLYLCKFCSAAITQRGRSDHYAWHARVNAKVLTVNQIKEVMDFLRERGVLDEVSTDL